MADGDSALNRFMPSDVHTLDIVGENYNVLQLLSPDKQAETLLVLGFKYTADSYFVLYQLENGDVYAKFAQRLTSGGVNSVEKKCEQLCGGTIMQGEIMHLMYNCSVLLLMSDGSLFSCGVSLLVDCHDSTHDLHLKRLPIQEAVVSIATGSSDALAMTLSAVFRVGGDRGVHKIYEASGSGAPYQVACSGSTLRVILLHDGHVQIKQPSGAFVRLKSLKDKRVEEIGCTDSALFALAHGVVYVMGYKTLLNNRQVLEQPTAVTFSGDRKVTSFRCSDNVIVAQLETKETFYWGTLGDGTEIAQPQPIPTDNHPRDIFGQGRFCSSGGIVYIDKYATRPKEIKRDSVVLVTERSQVKSELLVVQPEKQQLHDLSLGSPKQKLDTQHSFLPIVQEQLQKHSSSLPHEMEPCTPEQIEYINLQELHKKLLVEHEQLKKQCAMLQAEQEQSSSEQTEFKNLEKLHKDLIEEHEQLKKRYSVLQSESQSYKSAEIEHKNLEKQHKDLVLDHNELIEKCSILESEKEQLSNSYKELEIRHSKPHEDYSKSSQHDMTFGQGVVGSTCGLEYAAVNMVAKEVTYYWKDMSRFLGLEERVIEEIDRNQISKYKEKAHQALRKWEKRSGKNANKQVLIQALQDCGRKDIADTLRNM